MFETNGIIKLVGFANSKGAALTSGTFESELEEAETYALDPPSFNEEAPPPEPILSVAEIPRRGHA